MPGTKADLTGNGGDGYCVQEGLVCYVFPAVWLAVYGSVAASLPL